MHITFTRIMKDLRRTVSGIALYWKILFYFLLLLLLFFTGKLLLLICYCLNNWVTYHQPSYRNNKM